MTLSLPFFTTLRAFFAGAASTTRELPAPAPVQLAPAKPVQLARMLVLTTTRRGPRESSPFQMMATGMGENFIQFRSNFPVRQGEQLGVEFLLAGLGAVKATAQVEWVLSSSGSCKGELAIQVTPELQPLVAEFCRRQREGRR